MHLLLIIFEHISKFLENKQIKRIINLMLIISVLFLLSEASDLKEKLIATEEKIEHHQKSITMAFVKLNTLDDFIRMQQYGLMLKMLDYIK